MHLPFRLCLTISALLTFTFALQPLALANWSQYRGPGQNGIVSGSAASVGSPKKLWEKEVGTGVSQVVISDGRAYTMGNTGDEDVVYCLDAKTGKELWTFKYDCKKDPRQFEGGPAATPTVAGGKVFTLSHEGDLYALDAASGRPVWNHDVDKDFGGKRPRWGFAGSPTYHNGTLFVHIGGKRGSMLALDANSGSKKWQSGKHDPGYGTPVIFTGDGPESVLSFNGDGLTAYQTSNGKELWHFPWETSYDVNACMPIVSGNKIFIASGYNSGSALIEVSNSKPREVWRQKEFSNQMAHSVLVGDTIYGAHVNHSGNKGEQAFKAVDLNTGEILWSDQRVKFSSPIVVGNKMIILTEGGELIEASASRSSYGETARTQILGGTNWVAPSFSDGILYCRNNDGKVVALQI